MTVTNLLKLSGIKSKPWDSSKIGRTIIKIAREKKIKWVKAEEVITVNDYPDSFIGDMQEALIKYFSDKSK